MFCYDYAIVVLIFPVVRSFVLTVTREVADGLGSAFHGKFIFG